MSTLGAYTRAAGVADEDGEQSERDWRQMRRNAILLLLLLLLLLGGAAVGVSAGYGSTILDKLRDCCGDIKEALTGLSEQIAACCEGLTELINALSVLVTDQFNSIVGYFGTVISNQLIIIGLLQAPPAWAWQCATSYALPGPNCIELTQGMLPLTVPVSAAGACYVLQQNLTWGGNTFAITWNGQGVLYGCGFTITTTGTAPRVIDVVGNRSNPAPYYTTTSFFGTVGDLQVNDLTIRAAAPFYNDAARGISSAFGGRIALNSVNMHGFNGRATQAFAGSIVARDVNITMVFDMASPTRAANYAGGVYSTFNYGFYCNSGDCDIKGFTFLSNHRAAANGTADYSVMPYMDVAYGIRFDHNPDPTTAFSTPRSLRLRDANIVSNVPVFINRAASTDIDGLYVEYLAGIPPSNPTIPPDYNDAWSRLGCGRPTNFIARNIFVNARKINYWSGLVAPLWIVGTDGGLLENVNVFGTAPYTETWEWYGPLWGTPALITFFGEEDTRQVAPFRMRNVNVQADASTVAGVSVATRSDTVVRPDACYGANNTLSFDRLTVHGGGAGIVIGGAQNEFLEVRDSVFSTSYYGIYAIDGAANVDIDNCKFAKTCQGLTTEAGTAGFGLVNSRFYENSVDIVAGGPVYQFNVASPNPETYAECGPAPTLWDSTMVPCVFPTVASAGRRASADKFGPVFDE
jgi:hypothetical protein